MFRKLLKSTLPTLAKSKSKPNYEAFAQSKSAPPVEPLPTESSVPQHVSPVSVDVAEPLKFELTQAFTS